MLVLFDIDLTLLDARGAGADSLLHAGRRIFGGGFNPVGIDYAGRLDPLIVRDILISAGVEPTGENRAKLREAYFESLGAAPRHAIRALAGASALVEAVGRIDGSVRGLLTGNFERSGTIKLQSAGFDLEDFPVRVWGDHSPHEPPHRDHLPPLAMRRYTEHTGLEIDPRRVTVIGDTPHDVRCALASGCRCLAVATGRTGADELGAAGASRVIDDLTDTRGIIEWLKTP